ncbi:MAG TPA: LacI family DNA-binding transcriptional regulator [Solirubrobacteraceae bacterium]|jgi:DNA-binding LacI/PurR family transcriptional regulator|nr:LacI family DNA-binding transcriptional regulator [Solirubrobacteraceae bacterium]
MSRVTLRDVAEASGVSQSTVSFVLNEVPNQTISPATCERVRTAARELGYVPHGIARALMEGSSRIVVLNIERNREGNYSRNFIRGLDKELALYGFALLVRHGHSLQSDVDQITNVIAPRAVLQFGEAYLTGHELEDSGGGWKNGMAAHVLLQFRYLAERDHSRIALALPEDEPLAEVRLRFAVEVAEMLELPDITPLIVPKQLEQVAPALGAFHDEHPKITAIACFSDLTAFRVLAGMRELGLRAPADWAVIGFDESEYAEMFTPPLTTLTADAEGHGRLAARRALGLDTSDVKTKLGRVIERQST